MGCAASSATEVKQNGSKDAASTDKPQHKVVEAWVSPVPVPAGRVEEDAGGVELPKEWTQGGPSRPAAKAKGGQKGSGSSILGWFWSKPKAAKAPPAPAAAETQVDGVAVAGTEVLKALVGPIVVDARDPGEVAGGKGGPPLAGSVNIPFNVDGKKQSDRPTTLGEYRAKLEAGGFLPADKSSAIITHCGSGGRGGKACAVLRAMGYSNVHNGGSPDNIRASGVVTVAADVSTGRKFSQKPSVGTWLMRTPPPP